MKKHIRQFSKNPTAICCVLLVFMIMLSRYNYVRISEDLKPQMFIGPTPGETIILENPGGAVTKRTCLEISEDGVYSFEERISFPPPENPPEYSKEEMPETEYPEGVTPIPLENGEMVFRFTQQAVGTQIRYKEISPKTAEGISLDLAMNDPGYVKETTTGKNKYTTRIIEEDEEVVLGKKRRLLHVEVIYNDFSPITKVFTFASGLGIIHGEYRFLGFTFDNFLELREN